MELQKRTGRKNKKNNKRNGFIKICIQHALVLENMYHSPSATKSTLNMKNGKYGKQNDFNLNHQTKMKNTSPVAVQVVANNLG